MEYLKLLLCLVAMVLMTGSVEGLDGIDTEKALVTGLVLCLALAVVLGDRIQMLFHGFSPVGNWKHEGNTVTAYDPSGQSSV
jgi:hypothetical protein